MDKSRYSLLGLLLFVCVCRPIAQEAGIKVNLEYDTVYYGENIPISFEIDNLNGRFIAPAFNGFKIISGPSTSSSFISMNGKVEQKQIVSYLITPTEIGDIDLGVAGFQSKEETIYSEAISVVVLEDNDKQHSINHHKKKSTKYSDKRPSLESSVPVKKRTLKRL